MSKVEPSSLLPHPPPSATAASVENLVPGAELLGYGYNIFNSYSFEFAIRPLMDLGPSSPWLSESSGITYSLPANVTPPGGSDSSAQAVVFASSSEVNRYFQQSASVEGSIAAFSASFSASYSTDQQDSSSHRWALVEAKYHAWSVELGYSAGILLPSVSGDPDWSGLPLSFDPEDLANVHRFFEFFRKFGTHFIHSVSVGGTLYYYFAVSTSAEYSAQDISLSASAEYNGLIASTKVEADQHWGQCATNWTSNRQSHAATIPAVGAIVDWVNPPEGSYDESGNFAKWQTAVLNNPSRTKFSLAPIWTLFSGEQADALEQAFEAYANNHVEVRASSYEASTILVKGVPIEPPGGYPAAPRRAWHIVVLDARTVDVQLNKSYDVPIDYGADHTRIVASMDAVYDQMAADLQPYFGNSGSILAAVTFRADETASPNAAFYGVLKGFGAGAQVDEWMKAPRGYPEASGPAAYGLVGRGASGAGYEGYAKIIDESSPPPEVNLEALLLPDSDGFRLVPYGN